MCVLFEQEPCQRTFHIFHRSCRLAIAALQKKDVIIAKVGRNLQFFPRAVFSGIPLSFAVFRHNPKPLDRTEQKHYILYS
jgi:hypothetical protein